MARCDAAAAYEELHLLQIAQAQLPKAPQESIIDALHVRLQPGTQQAT